MGIELYWDNDAQTVMLIEIQGEFSWDDMYDALQKIKKVTDRFPVVIGAILDLTSGFKLPGGTVFNATGLQHAKNMLSMGQGGTGPVVVVGATGLIRKIVDWLMMMDRHVLGNVHLTDTLDQARATLQLQQFSYAPRALAGVGD